MDLPHLTPLADGRIKVAGELGFATVPALAARSAELFRDNHNLIIDLQEVRRADSAGLALLIEWQRQAARRRCVLSFANTPAQLLAMARVSGVEQLLSLQ
jgi:phospholipid transport system transporter-binding protein